MAAQRLAGRRALVTGASGGIGRAVAERLAAEGATVVLSGRNRSEGEAAAGSIVDAGGRASFVVADLAEGSDVVTALAAAAADSAGGAIDILVNNAAMLIPAQSMLEVSSEQIDAAFAVNVRAPFLLTAALVPSMVRAGGGAVINVGSVNGMTGMSVAALYGSTKAALHSLTTSFAAELASQGVRVNTVAPGPTMTASNSGWHDMLRSLTQTQPDRRPGTGEEVAAAVAFLASDDAAHIHGITLPIDGGMLSSR